MSGVCAEGISGEEASKWKSQQAFLDRQAQQVQTLEQSIVGSFKMEIDYNEASRRTDFLEGIIKEL